MENIIFTDYPDFRPHFTPTQMIQLGIMGGTIFSNVSKRNLLVEEEVQQRGSLSTTTLTLIEENQRENYDIDTNYFEVQTPGKWWTPLSVEAPNSARRIWAHWYWGFHLGIRKPEDTYQVARWKESIRILSEHLVKTLPANEVYDNSVSPNISQAMLEFAWDRAVRFDTHEVLGTPIPV